MWQSPHPTEMGVSMYAPTKAGLHDQAAREASYQLLEAETAKHFFIHKEIPGVFFAGSRCRKCHQLNDDHDWIFTTIGKYEKRTVVMCSVQLNKGVAV